MQPFLAMIMPVGGNGSGNYPDNTLPVPPPRWDTFPKPMPTPPPVAGWPGGLPGGGGFPGQGGPYPDNTLPQPPLGTWGGVGQPYPDQGLPGPQPGRPPGIWGGPWQPPYPSQGPGFPTHPIVLPPDLPPTLPDPDNRPIDWKTAWTPATGWVVIGVPQGPVPTPSSGQTGQSKF